MVSSQEYVERRRRVMDSIGSNGIAIIPGAHETYRNSDSEYLFRQNSDFYYLTRFKEPEAVAVLIPRRQEGEFVLFNRVRDPAAEIWTGRRAGQEGAMREYGADQAFPYSTLQENLPKLLSGRNKIYYPFAQNKNFDMQMMGWLKQLGVGARVKDITLHNLQDILHEMRLRKSPAEIELMRTAAKVSAAAHCRVMEICKPGMWEYELQAQLLYEFARHNCFPVPYNCIVGSGANSCVLHYNDNDAHINDGDIVLVDAAGEYQYYAADVTRTFPANGRFTPEQRSVYNVVLRAQKSTLQLVKPGVTGPELLGHSIKIISEGLLELGLLKGSLDEIIEKKGYLKFYMHNIGHWLGLDTHDVGTYRLGQEARTMEPNMVFTIEPGVYIQPDDDIEEKWWNIGIRIEDDVLVTENGNEVLTKDVPKEIDDIETLMRGRK